MKILQAKVDWFKGYGNSPTLKILVDKIPELETLRYEQKGRLYFAESEGYVSFFAYMGPENERGYGGREFNIILKDETEKVLKGPWSSRASCMNRAGFTVSVPCSITSELDVWNKGYVFYAAHITLEKALEAVKLCEEPIELIAITEPDKEFRYVVVHKGMTFEESQEFKNK